MQLRRPTGSGTKQLLHKPSSFIWVVVKIMVPFWVPNIVRHLLFRVPQKRDPNFDNHPYRRSPRRVGFSIPALHRETTRFLVKGRCDRPLKHLIEYQQHKSQQNPSKSSNPKTYLQSHTLNP